MGALCVGAAHDAASAALHEASDVGAGELESGREAKEDGGSESEADAEEENGQVHFDDGFGGKRTVGKPGDNDGEALPGEEDAERSSSERDGQGLGEELTDHAETVGAYSGAHGEFLLAFGAAREKKNGNIGATDKQKRGDGA